MTAMAGILGVGESDRVAAMLDRLNHRGQAGRTIVEVGGATIGATWRHDEPSPTTELVRTHALRDQGVDGRLAEAIVADGQLRLKRDVVGIAPLYFGYTGDNLLAFASEVKALLLATQDVQAVPPGHIFDGHRATPFADLQLQPTMRDAPDLIAADLRRRLAAAVEAAIGDGDVGSWLSGGLDSSAMAALARPCVRKLHTFAVGLAGAPDLAYAREVAAFIQADHREMIVTFDQMLAVLPAVIYHLESCDALLVRSSITNYLVAGLASDYVARVFSGEGGDELFAGYEYLKALPQSQLPEELLDITRRLHNTALQRVDRCAAAHGTQAHVCFLAPQVMELALKIPIEYKLRNGVEKWILREAMTGLLPPSVLQRTKAKFWEGAGVGDLLARYADSAISDAEFQRERTLPNGWVLNSKEELLYYRIFREQFGHATDLNWMGRTKGMENSAVS